MSLGEAMPMMYPERTPVYVEVDSKTIANPIETPTFGLDIPGPGVDWFLALSMNFGGRSAMFSLQLFTVCL